MKGLTEEVKYTTRIAPFIIIPRHELDKVLVQRDASLGVEDG